MPYAQRDGGGKVCGLYAQQQLGIPVEFLLDSDPEVVAFRNPPPPTLAEVEAAALAALNGGGMAIDIVKLLKAKFVSDLAFRLSVAPGALTALQLQNERARIAAIYKAL